MSIDDSPSHDRFQEYLKQIHALSHPPKSNHANLDSESDLETAATTSKFDILPTGYLVAGRYEIISFLGEGGMSMVYKAMNKQSNRPVAVKLLQKYLIADKHQIDRFNQEAEAAQRLNHPHIIKVFEGGYDPELKCFIAMDYLEGKSLADVICNDGPLAFRRAIKIFSQACDAFEHAHELGVIHRDVKPSNIMLTQHARDNDFVKILDFGTAKLLPSEGIEQQYLTRTGEVFGSPLYMSPEQCMGLSLDPRSDVYAMGCLMYEALTGKPPLVGSNVYETFHKQTYDAPAPLTNARPRPWVEMSHLDSIILKCMAKDPRDRYPSMAALKEALQEVGTESARPKGIMGKFKAEQALKKRRKKATGGKSGPPPGVVAAVIVATLSITGLIGFNLWQNTHLSGPIEQQIQTLSTRGQNFLNDGNYSDAEKSFNQALPMVQGRNDPPAHVALLYQLIDVFRAQLKDEPTIPLMANIVTQRQQYTKDTQNSIKELKAKILEAFDAGNDKKGESPDLTRLLGDMNSRAETDIRMGATDRAKNDLLPIVDPEKSLESNSVSKAILARTLHNIGTADLNEGNYQEAWRILFKAAEVRLDIHSPDIVATCDKLVSLARKSNSYASLKDLLQKAVESDALSDKQPALRYLLARLLFDEHKFKEDKNDTFADVQNNLVAAKNALEASHHITDPLYASTLILFGDLARVQQDFKGAIADYQKAVPLLENAGDDYQAKLATSLLGLANAYSDNTPSELQKAMPLYMRVFAMDMRIPGKEEELAETLSRIKWAKMQSGQLPQMADIYNFKLNIDTREANKPGTAQDYILLGRLNAQQGNSDQAIANLEKALTIRESCFSADSWEVCDILSQLGRTYADAGKMRVAEELLSRAKSTVLAKADKDKFSVSKHRELAGEVLRNYADLLSKTSREDQAIFLRDKINNLLP
jgi:tetratricopeptide (TPR) repeat protein